MRILENRKLFQVLASIEDGIYHFQRVRWQPEQRRAPHQEYQRFHRNEIFIKYWHF